MSKCVLSSLVVVAGLAVGCYPEDFPATTNATLEDANRVINDADLNVQQKREQLASLGLSPSAINALLNDERTGNQFGGDLRTAFNKVTGGRFTELTPDEVQIYGDEASAISTDDELDVEFTDDEAIDVTRLFNDIGITNRAALEAFLDQGNEPAGLVAGDVYRALFVDFDPNQLLAQLP